MKALLSGGVDSDCEEFPSRKDPEESNIEERPNTPDPNRDTYTKVYVLKEKTNEPVGKAFSLKKYCIGIIFCAFISDADI